jgi:outer membrane protein W
MLKKIFFSLVATATLALSSGAQAREGWSVGAQGLGNFFLTDSDPDLKIGPGGGLFFDYRFNQRWSIEVDLFVSFHDGSGISSGDNGMLLLGVPTAELKFYPRSQEATVEPYLFAGLGIYVLTEGDIDDNSGGVGVGGNLGAGVDFYVTNRFSLGFAVKFRPIALIQGGNNSAALINLGLVGNLAWHF